MGLCMTRPSWTAFAHIWFFNEKCAVHVLQILLAIGGRCEEAWILTGKGYKWADLGSRRSAAAWFLASCSNHVESMNACCVGYVPTSWSLDHRNITVCVCVWVCDLATSTVSRCRRELACSATKNGGKIRTRCMPKNEFLCRVLFSLRKLALKTSPVGNLEVILGGCSEVPHKEVLPSSCFYFSVFLFFPLSSFHTSSGTKQNMIL